MSFAGKEFGKNRTVIADALPLIHAVQSEFPAEEILAHLALDEQFEERLLLWLVRDSGMAVEEFVEKLTKAKELFGACKTATQKKYFVQQMRDMLDTWKRPEENA